MAEKFPPQTWPEYAEPTVPQLKAWIRTFGPEHDARVAADLLADMLGVEQNHSRGLDALGQRYAHLADRYRFAWISARARARGTRNAAIRLAREVAPLAAWSTSETIGIDPSPDFEAPPMALDAFPPEA